MNISCIFSARLIGAALLAVSCIDIYSEAKTIIKSPNHLRHKLFSPPQGPEKRSTDLVPILQQPSCFSLPILTQANITTAFSNIVSHTCCLDLKAWYDESILVSENNKKDNDKEYHKRRRHKAPLIPFFSCNFLANGCDGASTFFFNLVCWYGMRIRASVIAKPNTWHACSVARQHGNMDDEPGLSWRLVSFHIIVTPFIRGRIWAEIRETGQEYQRVTRVIGCGCVITKKIL